VLGEDRPLTLDALLTTDVIHDTVVVAFDPDAFRAELNDEPAFGRALSRYLFAQLLAAQDALAGSLLLPVRARVASHLLDLAERRGHELIVEASAQRLAATVGSVREVVSRVLREMESCGLLRRSGGELVLVDTAALHRLASGEGGGYWA
jgi:CRP-like cAMP-binding protein